jgi:hypothetical protein
VRRNWPRCESVSTGGWGEHRCELDMGHRGRHQAGAINWDRAPRKRYLVLPGYVTSANDGQRHWIGYDRLVRLYGVDPAECTSTRVDGEQLIELSPRYDGNYAVQRLCPDCDGYGWLPGGPSGTVCTGICEKCDASGVAP